MSNNNSSEFVANWCMNETKPRPQVSDYIELCYLAVAFFLGAPLNLLAYTKLIERRNSHGLTRTLLLKFHLNFTDLSVIFVYIAIRISNLLTYEFKGGPILCPAINSLKWICFASSSNIIVCIAFDRLLTVLFPKSHTGPIAFRRIKWMAAFGWLIAILSSIPQLFVHTKGTIMLREPYDSCQTTWSIQKAQLFCLSTTRPDDPQVMRLDRYTRYYQGAHTVVLFWLPLLIIVSCYAYILFWACYHLGGGGSDTTSCCRRRREGLGDPSDAGTPAESVVTAPRMSLRHEEITTTTFGNYNLAVAGHSRYGHRFSSRSSAQFPALIRAKRKLLRSALFIISAYIICWLPYNTLALLMAFNTSDASADVPSNYAFIYSFVVFNSVINPFLYGGVFTIQDCRCSCKDFRPGPLPRGYFLRRIRSFITSKSDVPIPELTVDRVP